MKLPRGWSLSRPDRAAGGFRWLVHRCGYISPVPVDLTLTENTARQVITGHVCIPAAATQVIHGHPCSREHL